MVKKIFKNVSINLRQLGNTSFGVQGNYSFSSNGWTISAGKGDNKCNIFVAAAYVQSGKVHLGVGGIRVSPGGNGVPVVGNIVAHIAGIGNVPVANDWAAANPNRYEGSFTKENSPMLGDLITYPNPNGMGHVTINIGNNTVIYAGNNDVKANTINGTKQDLGSASYTIRRYKP